MNRIKFQNHTYTISHHLLFFFNFSDINPFFTLKFPSKVQSCTQIIYFANTSSTRATQRLIFLILTRLTFSPIRPNILAVFQKLEVALEDSRHVFDIWCKDVFVVHQRSYASLHSSPLFAARFDRQGKIGYFFPGKVRTWLSLRQPVENETRVHRWDLQLLSV